MSNTSNPFNFEEAIGRRVGRFTVSLEAIADIQRLGYQSLVFGDMIVLSAVLDGRARLIRYLAASDRFDELSADFYDSDTDYPEYIFTVEKHDDFRVTISWYQRVTGGKR